MTVSADDFVALSQLAARYWAMADLCEDSPLAQMFLPDAVFDLGKLKLEGLPAIEKFFVDRARTMRESCRTTRHLATNFLVTSEGPDRARVRASVIVYAGNGEGPFPADMPSGIADFEDICLRQPDGRWLYHYRSGTTVFTGPNAASFAR